MARVMITGSADGLGLLAARLLDGDGHEVTLHARNPSSATVQDQLLAACAEISGAELPQEPG